MGPRAHMMAALVILATASISARRIEGDEVSLVVHVKFRSGTAVDSPERLLPAPLRDSVAGIAPLFSLGEADLNRLGARDAQRWFSIKLKPGVDRDRFIDELNQLGSVEVAEPVPQPAPPP